MIQELQQVTLEATTEYAFQPGCDYLVVQGANSTLQYWDGSGWVSYPSATGGATQDRSFIFVAPPSGRVQFLISSGTSVVAVTAVSNQ
jgi:hypothetical protein